MADWRQEDTKKTKPKGTPSPKPLIKPEQLSPPPTGGWKGKGAQPPTPTAPTPGRSPRSWTGAVAADAPLSSSVFRRWMAVGILFVAAVMLTIGLIAWAFWKPPRLWVIGFSVGDYSAPELLENPFGNAQRNSLATLDNINVQFITNEANGNDNALSDLRAADWADRFDSIRSKTLPPSGPSGKVTLFYINSFATFDADDNLLLLNQADSPFAPDTQLTSPLRLENVLSSIAETVPTGKLAWVVLDLQLPSGVSNLGALDPQWRTGGEQALNALDTALQQRLLLTLPGNNGQQNWVAPEFSGSFLGHHLRQLLEGRDVPQSLLSKQLTIGQFQELLNERVSRDVRNRRYAVQQPIWLPADNLTRVQSIQVLRMENAASSEQPKPAALQANIAKIHELWLTLHNSPYQKPYRWDPLGYAMIESQLLGLEDIVFNQLATEHFQQASDLVEKAIGNLQLPVMESEVSLIESQLLDEYLRGDNTAFRSVNELARQRARNLPASEEQLPSFWRKPPADEKEAELRGQSPSAEEQLSDKNRAHFLWQFFVACAQSNDRNVWQEAFQPNRLRAAIEFAGPAARQWLEVNLLVRMAEDIDWSVADRQSAEACARVVMNFDRFQRLTCHPDPESSWWWLRDGEHSLLLPIEAEFLRAIDHCLAGKFSDCLDTLDQVVNRLPALEQRALEVQTAITLTHEALYALPHLLAWSLKEFQFAPEQELSQVEERLQSLAQLANISHEVSAILANPPSTTLDSGLTARVGELQKRLERLQLAFAVYVEQETSSQESAGAIDNPLPFRRGRIALLSPMLQLEARQRLHENSQSFLSLALTGGGASGGVGEERSARKGGEIFLSDLKQEAGKWRSLIMGDAREQLNQQFNSPPPASTDPRQLRTALWKQEYWQRVFAPAFGHSPTLHAKLATANRVADSGLGESLPWPWSGPWQRWSLALANDRTLQVQRIAQSRWGNSVFNEQSTADSFYFYQLASRLRLPPGFGNMEPAKQFAEDFQSTMQQAKEQGVQQIKSLRPQFGQQRQVIRPTGEQRAPVQVAGDLMNGLAQVFLGTPTHRLPWQRGQAEGAWVVDLSQVEFRTVNKTFDATYWQSNPPAGTLLFRGNSRTAPIDWKVDDSKQEAVELTLVKPPAEESTVRVFSPEAPAITVLLLIDCSDSMSTRVKFVQEGKLVEDELFKLVKASAVGVIKKLAAIHNQREAVVRVALMPFGLNRDHVNPQLLDLLSVGQDNFYKPKQTNELDGNWQADLERGISLLRPSGDTPLYDAIAQAASLARANEKTLIYVFSDGVNYIRETEQRLTSKSHEDVRRTIKKNPLIRLSIFHFNYFDNWVSQKFPDPSDQTFWESRSTDGIAQLKDLESLGEKQYGYYLSDQGVKLMQESLDSIPRARVNVASLSTSGNAFSSQGHALNEEIPVPAEFLPAELSIEVERPFSSKCIVNVQVLGGEKLYLPYNSQGKFEFERFNSGGKLQVGVEGTSSGSGLSSRLFVRKLQDRVLSQKVLGFELHFASLNSSEFTRRPAWLVAEVSPADAANATTFVLADHRFKPNTHYPEVNLSDVPWFNSRQPARLRIWAADDIPAQVTQLALAANEPHEPIQLGIATVQFAAGEKIVAKVEYSTPPRPQDRVVIVCPSFLSARRTFDQNTHVETHEFEIPKDAGPPSLQLTTIGSLEEAAKASSVSQFVFDQVSVGG